MWTTVFNEEEKSDTDMQMREKSDDHMNVVDSHHHIMAVTDGYPSAVF